MATAEHIQWLLEGVASWNSRREQHPFTPDLSDEDLYAIFSREGKLSETGRMPLAGINLRKADLRGARLSCRYRGIGPHLMGADLSWADLEKSQIPNSILDGAILHGTIFRDAKLHNASLLDVKMAGTVLVGADLSRADLTGVTMNLVSLAKVNLAYATLVDTDLTQANLVGADLSCSRPWKAKLYRGDRARRESHEHASSDERITSVADLIERVREIRDRDTDRVLYLRGERTDDWKLQPYVMRSSNEEGAVHRTRESDMLTNLMTRRPGDFTNATSALSQLVLGQHHGLPTRLLDVTKNPLVALFWACQSHGRKPGRVHLFSVPRDLIKPFNSDTISIIANFAKLSSADKNVLLGWTLDEAAARDPDSPLEYIHENAMRRLYQLVSLEKPYFQERIDPRDLFRVLVVEPMQSFERIRVQAGAFLVSAFHERFERSKILEWNPDIPVYDHDIVIVPSGKKEDILGELRLLNITREGLLPGLDEAARAIARFS